MYIDNILYLSSAIETQHLRINTSKHYKHKETIQYYPANHKKTFWIYLGEIPQNDWERSQPKWKPTAFPINLVTGGW